MVNGNIITIDAMGCQENIAEAITTKGGDYVIAVKANQPQLLDDIEDSFRAMGRSVEPNESYGRTVTEDDFGHGRIEKRTVTVLHDLSLIDNRNRWHGLNTIVRVESDRYNKTTTITEAATRYYISSLPCDPKTIARAIRSHWGIENNLHWMLDVAFSEDNNRKRNSNAVMNFSLLNKIAMVMLKKDSSKAGMKSKRLMAGWDNTHLQKIMGL